MAQVDNPKYVQNPFKIYVIVASLGEGRTLNFYNYKYKTQWDFLFFFNLITLPDFYENIQQASKKVSDGKVGYQSWVHTNCIRRFEDYKEDQN